MIISMRYAVQFVERNIFSSINGAEFNCTNLKDDSEAEELLDS